ncbi:MAG: hypothetical protein OXE57_21830 [Alphaproteobacteria bacterium]|nr:hypothetical protein [Alphaproteobacteria bacterium]
MPYGNCLPLALFRLHRDRLYASVPADAPLYDNTCVVRALGPWTLQLLWMI